MYGREPNEFTADISLSDQDITELRLLVACQRRRLVAVALELKPLDSSGSSGWFGKTKREKLLEKLNRERKALDDVERAHTVAIKNNVRFQDIQSDYYDELDDLFWKDKDLIDKKIEALKEQDEEQFLLVRIRNLLVDFMGMIELRMKHQDRIRRYESGGPIGGSSVNARYVGRNHEVSNTDT